MPYSFHFIPLYEPGDAAAGLNRFLAEHRVVTVDRQFLPNGAQSGWAVSVHYTSAGHNAPAPAPFQGPKRGRIDYRERLNPVDFAVFSRLRALRKERADSEGVPPYALFTDAHLAEMVTRRTTTASALKEIDGVGDAKIEKYGAAFIHILCDAGLPTPAADAT